MILIAQFLFWILLLTLIISKLTDGYKRPIFRIYRLLLLLVGWGFMGYWVYQKTFSEFNKNELGLRINNLSDTPLDFYVLQRNDKGVFTSEENLHFGNIRKQHYRLDPIAIDRGKELWVSAYQGDKLYLFRQIQILSQNEDVNLDVNEPFVQSEALSKRMHEQIETFKNNLVSHVVLLTFNILMLFILSVVTYRSFKIKNPKKI